MKTIKRIAALMAIVMIFASIMAMPAFAQPGADGTNTTSGLNTEIVRKTYTFVKGNDDWDDLPDGSVCPEEKPYSATVVNDSKTYNICLRERPNAGDVSVKMNNGRLEMGGMGKGDSNAWNNIFNRYRTVIVGISGIGAITMIVFFIINFMKLGSSAGNPQARSQALTGVLWTGLAAAGLGAVSIIAGFFYNAV